MKIELIQKEKMLLEAQTGDHTIYMDANPPFGKGAYPTPKQLLLASMAGCTAMDVISLMNKHKQNVESFKVTTDAENVTTQPQVFTKALIEFFVEGPVDAAVLNESIQLSLSKYCSVNAMISKAVPIHWKAYINSQPVGEGQAEFTF